MARCSIRDSADGLTRALLRLYAETGIAIDVHVRPDLSLSTRRRPEVSGRGCASRRERRPAEAGHYGGGVLSVVRLKPDPTAYGSRTLQRCVPGYAPRC